MQNIPNSLNKLVSLTFDEDPEVRKEAARSLKNEKGSDLQIKDLDLRKKEFLGKINVVTKDLNSKLAEKERLVDEKNELGTIISEFESRLDALNSEKEEKGKHLLKSSKKEITSEYRHLKRK